MYPLPCLSFITLITYQFSCYSSLVLLAFVLACACVPPSPHPIVHVLFAYQHTWFCLLFFNLFSFLLPSHQSFSFFYLFTFFSLPAPLLVCHFSLLLPLNPSRLASASFPSLPVCSLCCLCCSVAVRVSWTVAKNFDTLLVIYYPWCWLALLVVVVVHSFPPIMFRSILLD